MRVTDQYCEQCGKIMPFENESCSVCLDSRKRAAIVAWNELTVAQRLNNLRERIEKLEQGPVVC